MSQITLYAQRVRTVTMVEATAVRVTVNGKRIIQELCRKAGLKIGEWYGEVASLFFTDIDGYSRIITIRIAGDGRLKFSAYSYAAFPRGKVPPEVLSVICGQGKVVPTLGQWEMCSFERNLDGFSVSMSASLDDLDGPYTNWICSNLLLEVVSPDYILRLSGFIK